MTTAAELCGQHSRTALQQGLWRDAVDVVVVVVVGLVGLAVSFWLGGWVVQWQSLLLVCQPSHRLVV